MRERFRRLTLGDKVLLALGSLLVLEAGVRGYLDWTRAAETCHEQFMRTGRDHVRNVAYTARSAFAKGDAQELADAAELLRTPDDSDLLYVAFYGADGRLVASRTWPQGAMAVPARIQPVTEPMVLPEGAPDGAGFNCSRFMFPMIPPRGDADRKAAGASPVQAGTVAAVRSYEKVTATVAEEQVARLIVTAAMLALCLNVLLVFGRRLASPIEALVRGTQRIAAGHFGTPVDVGKRSDELRTLADSFNHMAEEVARQREQILAQNRQLEQKVGERTTELVEANQRLRQTQAELVQSEKMRMLGQLAAGIAHEINTPTGAILNCSTDTQEHLRALVAAASRVPELPPPAREWLARVVAEVLDGRVPLSDAAVRGRRREMERALRARGCADYRRVSALAVQCGLEGAVENDEVLAHLSDERALGLLESLVALSGAAEITRLSAEKIARIVRALRLYTRGDEPELLEMDVNETLDNTVAILQNRIKHIAHVRTRYADDLPLVRCGADISQVWTNLLNNACDAIEDLAEGRPGWIAISSAPAGDRVRVTVTNSGRPIPDEVLGKMFDPFFTTKPVGRGTGLGLGICKAVLRRCGGSIEARNEAEGVTFEVTLPAAAPVAAGQASAVGAAGTSGG